jgi:hypothetical protein
MTGRNPIVHLVHTTNDSFQERRVPHTVFTRIESDVSELGDMTELTPILYSVHTYNDKLQR